MASQLADVLNDATQALSIADSDTPRLDARLLIAHALGMQPNELIVATHIEISDEQLDCIRSLILRRREGEPVSRIIGRREFWSLPLMVTPDTLDPRPDSETLVEVSLKIRQEALPRNILDAGTGTGCLLISLLTEWSEAYGIGLDISERALQVAGGNAARLGVRDRCKFVCSNWLTPITGKFDLIVSNPPYIGQSEFGTLSRSVRDYDPQIALLAGEDGLDAYRALIPQCYAGLAPGGHLVVEIGMGQSAAVGAVVSAAGFGTVQTHKDLSGIDRCLSAVKI